MRSRLSLIFILMMLVALTACKSSATDANGTPTPIPTPIVPNKPVYEVQRGDIVKELEFFGRIAPVEEKELFFRESGYVKNVYVSKGDTVVAGQILAELENLSDLERLKVTSQFQVRLAELDLIDAQLELENFELGLPDSLKFKFQAIDDAEKAVEDYQAVLNSAQTPDVKLAEAKLAEAQLALTKAQAEMERLKAFPYLFGYLQELIMKKNEVERAQIMLDQIKLTNLDLDDAIADAKIVAPFDGNILVLGLSEGRSVEAFAHVIVVADTDVLEVIAELTGTELNGLSVGMPVFIELFNAPGETANGTIRQLPSFSSTSDGSKNEVDPLTRIQLVDPPSEFGFELNDRVRVTVILEQKKDVIWLPPQAVRSFEGRNFVVLQDRDVQRRVDIKIGLMTGDRIEVLPVEGVENLSEGQVIIGP